MSRVRWMKPMSNTTKRIMQKTTHTKLLNLQELLSQEELFVRTYIYLRITAFRRILRDLAVDLG